MAEEAGGVRYELERKLIERSLQDEAFPSEAARRSAGCP